MAAAQLLFDVEGPVACLTFNRPDARNALTWEMYDGLVAACDRVDGADGVRVLVLRGAGGRAFAAGTDIGQFTTFTTREDTTEPCAVSMVRRRKSMLRPISAW